MTWTKNADGRLGPAVLECLTAAIAAPSVHNTQPWRFRIREHLIEVYADRERQLEVLDPSGRELVISVGAAILNLRVAILAHGRLPTLRALPDPVYQPQLLARVTIGDELRPPYVARRLAWAIPRRHSNRRPFTATAIPDEVLDELRAAARTEGADLVIADSPLRDSVLAVVRTAESRRHDDPDYLLELAEWTAPGPGRRDGVPAHAYPPQDADGRLPMREFGLAHPASYGWPVPFEDDPLIGVLYTAEDGPHAWLAAGQALQRTLLTATARSVESTLMTQPLEYPELRSLFDDTAQGRVAQTIVRLGYGPPAPPSPRRPLADVLLP
jgi:nitroreductase